MRHARRTSRAAFTLIELLVAVSLMLILTVACATIFAGAGEILLNAEAQKDIYQNARAAVDLVGRDINGTIPLSVTPDPGGATYQPKGKFVLYDPADAVEAVESYKDKLGNSVNLYTVMTLYTTARVDGQATVTWVRYSLKESPDPSNPDVYKENPLQREIDADQDGTWDGSVDNRELPEDVCQYVREIRVEYLDHTLATPDFVVLDSGGTGRRIFDNATTTNFNDGSSGLPRLVRVTMVVVDDFNRQQRTITRTFEIPSS